MTRRTRPVLSLLAAVATVPALVLSPASPASGADRPAVLQLPGDFAPEGIAGGPGTTFFAGSRPGPTGGAIYRGDLRTGEGSVIVPPTAGGASIGMSYDERTGLLWVAGGNTGTVSAYDVDGTLVRRYVAPATANSAGRFLNDVEVTKDGVFVTDSLNAELVVIRTSGKRLPAEAKLLRLTGDWRQGPGFNANGIRALPGGDLLVVDMGTLLRVDPDTGVATLLPQTGGPDLTNGDGLELRGNTLYVVFGLGDDSVAVVDLQRGARSYAVTDVLRKPLPVEDDLQRPTTALFALGDLYVVNGKFGAMTTDQEIVRLDLR